jgi:hypothetical protein
VGGLEGRGVHVLRSQMVHGMMCVQVDELRKGFSSADVHCTASLDSTILRNDKHSLRCSCGVHALPDMFRFSLQRRRRFLYTLVVSRTYQVQSNIVVYLHTQRSGPHSWTLDRMSDSNLRVGPFRCGIH